MAKQTTTITLADRLNHGEITLAELSALKSVGLTKIYADIREGRLPIKKRGRATRVLGPHARAYIPGEGVGGEASMAPAAESAPQKNRVRSRKAETTATA